MNAVFLLVGLMLGAGATALLLRGRLRALTAEAARTGEIERRLALAERDLEHERVLATERLAALQDVQNQLPDRFKALSSEALQAGMEQLTALARSQLQTAQAEARGELDERRRAVEQLVGPLAEQLGKVDERLARLDADRRASASALEAQLRSLNEAGDKLRLETGALVTALRKPNARGQWGQMQLRNVVELAGLVRHCDFTEQHTIDAAGGEATLRPDLVVRMPGGKHVVVDAKAPLQGVLDAYEARDEATREGHLRDHARLLRKHVRQLSEKAYWEGMETSPDFVVLFLPGEHLYGAALEADPTLLEEAMARRVLIATPTTLLALFRSVAYGWQQERVAESAQEVADLGRELHVRLAKLAEHFMKLGKRLNSAVSAYNETVGSYETRVVPSARRLAEHGGGEEREVGRIEQVTLAARTVRIAEAEEGLLGEAEETSPATIRAARLWVAE